MIIGAQQSQISSTSGVTGVNEKQIKINK